MKKILFYLIISLFFLVLHSCAEDEDIDIADNYVEFIVEEKEYLISNAECSFVDSISSMHDNSSGRNKPITRVNVGEIDNSSFIFDFYFSHYTNLFDFDSLQPGYNDIYTLDGGSGSNLGILINFKEKSEIYTSFAIGSCTKHHIVTDVNLHSENDTEINYLINGEFSIGVVSDSGKFIDAIGRYQVNIKIMK